MQAVHVSRWVSFSDLACLPLLLVGLGLSCSPERVVADPATDSAADQPGEAGGTGSTSTGERRTELEQVIVTAQKRDENLQDVPVPVTALSADTLLDANQTRIQDYFASIPGLSLSTSGHGDVNLSVRGLTTGGITNPTVGITVDDVPFGSTIALGSRTLAPDIDPSDLARVEVLRGPQGTLYGASSIGGLLKFVTVDPSTARFTGRLEGDFSSVRNGDTAGYGVRGAVNVPVTDDFAVRASAFARRDPGYIDDPAFHQNGLNQVDVAGGRFSALWRMSQSWSLKLSALLQNMSGNGQAYATLQPGLGDLQQAQTLPVGRYHHDLQSYAATLTGDIAGMNLVAISGYGIDRFNSLSDLSTLYGFASAALFGVPGAEQFASNETKKFTQEVRLSGTLRQRFDWLLGVFYTHEDTPTHDLYAAADPANPGAPGAMLLDDPYPTIYSEYAVFGDLTIHFTDAFDIQFGGRESENRQSYQETLTGPLFVLFGLPSPSINPLVHTKDNAFTYLVIPRLKLNEQLMLYARFASGYRPGGPNPTCILFSAPCHYEPDKTLNYEIGVKSDAFDHRLSVDASAYYIDWKNIQIQVSDPSTGGVYYTNASRAKSKGLELELRARPGAGLTLAAWAAWNDATLSSDLPTNSSAFGLAGDRLPYSARISGNVSVEEDFPLLGTATGYVAGSLSYTGERKDYFPASSQQSRLSLPGYAQTNLRAGVRYNSWAMSLFVNNVGDKRGILEYPISYATSFQTVTYIQPRTAGLSLSKTF